MNSRRAIYAHTIALHAHSMPSIACAWLSASRQYADRHEQATDRNAINALLQQRAHTYSDLQQARTGRWAKLCIRKRLVLRARSMNHAAQVGVKRHAFAPLPITSRSLNSLHKSATEGARGHSHTDSNPSLKRTARLAKGRILLPGPRQRLRRRARPVNLSAELAAAACPPTATAAHEPHRAWQISLKFERIFLRDAQITFSHKRGRPL